MARVDRKHALANGGVVVEDPAKSACIDGGARDSFGALVEREWSELGQVGRDHDLGGPVGRARGDGLRGTQPPPPPPLPR